MIQDAEKLFEIVTQRPDRSLSRYSPNARCPFCESRKIVHRFTEQTAMSNGNHVWEVVGCQECKEKFVIESRGLDIWYTQARKVLRGFPGCFEAYIYTCSKCGGSISRACYNKSDNSKSETISFSYHDGTRSSSQYYKYECDGCGVSITTDP